MKLEALLKRLNEVVAADPTTLQDEVILSLEHDKADTCDVVRVGYSDKHPSNWLLEHDEIPDWIDEMGYADLDEAIEDYRMRKVVMLF